MRFIITISLILVLSLQAGSQSSSAKSDIIPFQISDEYLSESPMDTLSTDWINSVRHLINTTEEIGGKEVYGHPKIGGLVIIEYPEKKGFLGKKLLKADQQTLGQFVANHFPDYILVDSSKDGKGSKNCKKLVLVHRSATSSFFANPTSTAVSTARWLKQHLPYTSYPHSEAVYFSLLNMAKTPSDVRNMIQYAPTVKAMRAAHLSFLAATVTDVSRLQIQADKIMVKGAEQQEMICIAGLQQGLVRTPSEIKYYQEVCGCNPELAIRQAPEFLPCNELLSFADSLPARYKAMHLENIECSFVEECLSCKEDWNNYQWNFQNSGSCQKTAFIKITNILMTSNQHWVFLRDNMDQAVKYRASLKEPLFTSLHQLEDVLNYNSIYDDSISYREALRWGMNNLNTSEMKGLMDRPGYAKVKDEIENLVYSLTESNSEWQYFFIEYFPNSLHLKGVYLNVIEQETDPNKKQELLLNYMQEFGEDGIDEIKNQINCNLIFDLVGSNPTLATEMYSRCLECVKDKKTLVLFGKTYAIEKAFPRVANNLSAEDLRELYASYTVLWPKIAPVYFVVAQNTIDTDWFLRNYPEEIRRQNVSKKGIDFEREDVGRGTSLTERVAEHLLDFGLDEQVIAQNIRCEQMPAFLELIRNVPWFEEVTDIALKCADSRNISTYKKYFDKVPGFQKMLHNNFVENLGKVLNANSSVPPLSFSQLSAGESDTICFDTKEFQNPFMQLNGKGFDSEVKIELYIGSKIIRNPFSEDRKLIPLDGSSTKGCIVVTNLKKKQLIFSSNSSPLSFQIYDCPTILKGRIDLLIGGKLNREHLQKSCEKIWEDKATRKDIENILGYQVINYIGQSGVGEKELEGMASQVAELYITLAKPHFSQDWLDSIVRKWDRATR